MTKFSSLIDWNGARSLESAVGRCVGDITGSLAMVKCGTSCCMTFIRPAGGIDASFSPVNYSKTRSKTVVPESRDWSFQHGWLCVLMLSAYMGCVRR